MSARFCGACGRSYRGDGRTALVIGPGSTMVGAAKRRVCGGCASRALLVVQSSAQWQEHLEQLELQERAERRRRAAEQRRAEKASADNGVNVEVPE